MVCPDAIAASTSWRLRSSACRAAASTATRGPAPDPAPRATRTTSATVSERPSSVQAVSGMDRSNSAAGRVSTPAPARLLPRAAARAGDHQLGVSGIGLECPVENQEVLADVSDPQRAVPLEAVTAVGLEYVAVPGNRLN